ncbi:MAG: class I SAM-dependent methyltransferase [Balneolaceae bacterium]
MSNLRRWISKAAAAVAPERWKSFAELHYWKQQKQKEGHLSNDHYPYFYTKYFGLPYSFYDGKRILDIGCGPRGSLEWADTAKQRVGLDPLADEYARLGADAHAMEYVASGSESIPFGDGHFDVVCAFNSLDHVSDVEHSIREIKRVTAHNGLFLLMVEINHPPTECEPHELSPHIVDAFGPEFDCITCNVYPPEEQGLYQTLQHRNPVPHPMEYSDQGWLTAQFRRAAR